MHTRCEALINKLDDKWLKRCSNTCHYKLCYRHNLKSLYGTIDEISILGIEKLKEYAISNPNLYYDLSEKVKGHKIEVLQKKIDDLQSTLKFFSEFGESDKPYFRDNSITKREYIIDKIWDLRNEIAFIQARFKL
jgi:hypothetical protein